MNAAEVQEQIAAKRKRIEELQPKCWAFGEAAAEVAQLEGEIRSLRKQLRGAAAQKARTAEAEDRVRIERQRREGRVGQLRNVAHRAEGELVTLRQGHGQHVVDSSSDDDSNVVGCEHEIAKRELLLRRLAAAEEFLRREYGG